MDSRIIVVWTCMLVAAESSYNYATVDRDQPSWMPSTMTSEEFYQNHGMDSDTATEHKTATRAYKTMVSQFYGREVNIDDEFIDDTILTLDQIQRMTEEFKTRHQQRTKRKVIDFSSEVDSKWTLPILYDFDGNQPDEDVTLIEKAMENWESQTCLTFRRRESSDTEHFIIFTAEDQGCWSYIGKVENYTSPQMVNFQTPSCTYWVGRPMHEIGHALGLFHEQARPDRDQYVDISLEYVIAGAEDNFEIIPSDEIATLGVSYDFSSTMHYPRRLFSTDPLFDTVTPKNPAHYRTIGQNTELTFWDAKIINLAYCPDACSGVTLDCQHEGYADPDDCSVCRCPPGLGGTLCDQLAASDRVCNTDGEVLMAAETDAVLQSPEFDTSGIPSGTKCNWFVQAPGGCTVDFTIERSLLTCANNGAVDDETCQSWLEIRDQNEGHGQRVCCESQEGDVVTSTGNETILTLRALDPRSNSGIFKILYKLTDASCVPSPTDPPPVPGWGYALIALGGLAIIFITVLCISLRSANAAAKVAGLGTSGQTGKHIYDTEDAQFYGYSPQGMPQGRNQNLSSYSSRLGNGAVSGYYPTMTPWEFLPQSGNSASAYGPRI